MPDLKQALTIFKLQENYSQTDLQKSYKQLVKKYHPDSNPANQEWAHKRMTEINLAYEQCLHNLKEKDTAARPSSHPSKTKEQAGVYPAFHPSYRPGPPATRPAFWKELKKTARVFHSAGEIFFEYGLENRRIRREGIRRFRYRECLRILKKLMPEILELERSCPHGYDRILAGHFTEFTGSFYNYVLLQEKDIPSHPLLNKHWKTMETHLLWAVKDYLTPHLIQNYRQIHWETAITLAINQEIYMARRFPGLQKSSQSFHVCSRLTESYKKIRKEELETGIHFFPDP